jgi:ketosteroid isomerase-like protein
MRANKRLVLEAAYASWAAGDAKTTLACFAKGIRFAVYASPDAPSFIGEGCGRYLLAPRIELFLADYEVAEYRVQHTNERHDGSFDCSVSYAYRHKRTGLPIDGNMRHKWRLLGDKIVQFELFHDAKRMAAYYEMVARADTLV